ncbi:MAG: protein kinase family protein [Planctomycetota bacterium]|jgi:hypothetical protein
MGVTGDTVVLGGVEHRVLEVMKEDRYARSRVVESPEGRRLVFKESVMRLPPGVRVPPLAALLARHEADLYEHLQGIDGIPRFVSRPGADSFLREYVDGDTVRNTDDLPAGFFGRLEALLLEVHGRGVAYVDLAKEENVLVGRDGAPWLIDFQVSVGEEGPFRRLVGYLQREDLYHLSKMRLRRVPAEATDEDRKRVKQRSALSRLHRATVKKVYNILTRYLVRRWSGAGEGRPARDLPPPPDGDGA